MALISEFKEFVAKGNVVDLAVGVVIGAAFGKIVDSFVNDIIMPPVGLLIGGVNFADLKMVMKDASVDAAGKAVAAVTVNYGAFIQQTIVFLIVAFVIFLFVVKPMNAMKRKEVAPPPAPEALSKDQMLLSEIRDLLLQQIL